MITSCLECRRRKLKCNKSHPCANCVKFTRDCVFLAPALDQASQLKLTEIKEKVGSLERLLERDVAKNAAAAPLSSSQDRALPGEEDDDLPANEDERDLEPTPPDVIQRPLRSQIVVQPHTPSPGGKCSSLKAAPEIRLHFTRGNKWRSQAFAK